MPQPELLETLSLHLNGGPDQVCVLDAQGRISWVNAEWQRFADENGYRGENWGVEENYIETCQNALGPSELFSRMIGQQLRALLNRRRLNVFAYYPCHSPEEKRWYSINAFRLEQSRSHPRHIAAVVHSDVTSLVEPFLLEIDDADEYYFRDVI